MANVQQTAQQVRQALDKITQNKDNPQKVEQAVNEAKQQVEKLVQEAQQ